MGNQRQFHRLPSRLEVDYSELKWGEGNTLTGMTENVSANGILLRSPKPYPLGTILKIHFRIAGLQWHRAGFHKPNTPETQHITILGRVVRIEENPPGDGQPVYDIGVVFVNIDPDDQEALMNYIETKRKEESA